MFTFPSQDKSLQTVDSEFQFPYSFVQKNCLKILRAASKYSEPINVYIFIFTAKEYGNISQFHTFKTNEYLNISVPKYIKPKKIFICFLHIFTTEEDIIIYIFRFQHGKNKIIF